MKRFLLGVAALLALLAASIGIPQPRVAGVSVLPGQQGGTGIATTTAGNIGNCLKVTSVNPLVYTIDTCGSAGDPFTTTTVSVAGTTLSSTAYIIASSSDTNLGITVTGSGSTLTFTPLWIGTLADGRISSAATWNAKQNALSFPLSVALGGTATSTHVKGILVASGTSPFATLTGSDGKVLTASSSAPLGFSFETPGAAAAALSAVFSTPRGWSAESGFGATAYNDTSGASNYSSTETDFGNVMPYAGTLKNLYIDVSLNTLNSGNCVYTLMVNGVATSIAVTVAAGVTSITGDTANTASVSAGDRVTLRAVAGGTSGTTMFSFAYVLTQ